jgi:1-acyl-sn-glycerol-3-phosphate acyltransferase
MQKLVQRNLRGIWVRGELPAGPAIWVSNHHSWWDYFVAAVALRSAGRSDTWVLVDPQNVGNERLFRSAGAIGSTEIRQAVANVVSGGVLVVFVEGQLRSAGPVTSTRPGATWLARRSGAPVVAVATRVVLRGHQAPEAYLDVAPPDADGGGCDLNDLVAGLDQEIQASDPELPLAGFRQVVRGVRSWHERFGGTMVGR